MLVKKKSIQLKGAVLFQMRTGQHSDMILSLVSLLKGFASKQKLFGLIGDGSHSNIVTA